MGSKANHNAISSSSEADHSPRHSTIDNNNPVNSPQSRRGSVRSGSSPWVQIVRESESAPSAVAAAPSSSPSSNSVVETQVEAMSAGSSSYSAAVTVDGNADNENGSVAGNAGRKLAWNKPSNGAVEIEPVMGADSWPALSESARIKSSSDSLKGLPDGSSPTHVSQGTGTASSSSQKQHTVANTNSAPIHPVPTRQRSMKRDGASTSSNGGTSQPPGSQGLGGELAMNNTYPGEHGRSYPGDHGRRISSRSGNDHPSQQRNSFRNHNGPHWGRRDQDRANHDWNHHRNFGNRDAHMQPHRGSPRFVRPPPPPPPAPPTPHFVAPPPMRPYAGYPEMASVYYISATPQDSLRNVPFAPMPAPVYYSVADFQLQCKIGNQIDYYFSDENLIKDIFLRQNMDDQGWVPIKLIAGFNKVSYLTDNIQLILESIRNSSVVEVQGDKVRRQKDWMRWIMPTPLQFSNVSSPRSRNNSPDSLAANFQAISVEEKTSSSKDNAKGHADIHTGAFPGTFFSGDLNNQSQPRTGGEAADVGARGGVDSPSTRRNSIE